MPKLKEEESKFNKNLGRKLYFKRMKLNMTRREVAEKIGVIQQHISAIENGKLRISFFKYLEICKVYKIHPIKFLTSK